MPVEIREIKQTSSSGISGYFLKYDGEVVITSREDLARISSKQKRMSEELGKAAGEIEGLRKKLDESEKSYAQLQSNYSELLDKYNKFVRNQRRLDENLASICYYMLRENPNVAVKEIHNYFVRMGSSHSYETTRLYVKAIRDGRLQPRFDQQGQLTRFVGSLV